LKERTSFFGDVFCTIFLDLSFLRPDANYKPKVGIFNLVEVFVMLYYYCR